jgi:hypothetical protein
MEMRINSVLAKSKWLALVRFQESAEVPESAKVLVGHWRKTTTPGRTGHHTQLEHHRESRDHP